MQLTAGRSNDKEPIRARLTARAALPEQRGPQRTRPSPSAPTALDQPAVGSAKGVRNCM